MFLLKKINLWILISLTQLQQQEEDTISWNLTPHGSYTTASAYKAQFISCIKTPELATICKTWAPPMCKFFAWLIIQNRVWTSNILARRNWDHNPTCPLCRMTMEMTLHLVSSYRYSRQVWALVAEWVGLTNLHPNEWAHSESALHWWTNITTAPDIPRQGTCSITLLVL
jgi:hypothetical protein